MGRWWAGAVWPLLDLKNLVQKAELEASSHQAAGMVTGGKVSFPGSGQSKDVTQSNDSYAKIFGNLRMHQRFQNSVKEPESVGLSSTDKKGLARFFNVLFLLLLGRTFVLLCWSCTKPWIVNRPAAAIIFWLGFLAKNVPQFLQDYTF